MSFDIIKYIGDSAKRIISAQDVKDLGATEDQLKSLSQNSVLTFVKGAAHELETGLAHFIANHPSLANEFHILSEDEAADIAQITNPVSEGAAPGSTEPAGTTPAEPGPAVVTPVAEQSPAETATTELAAPTEPSPSTSEVAAEPNAQ